MVITGSNTKGAVFNLALSYSVYYENKNPYFPGGPKLNYSRRIVFSALFSSQGYFHGCRINKTVSTNQSIFPSSSLYPLYTDGVVLGKRIMYTGRRFLEAVAAQPVITPFPCFSPRRNVFASREKETRNSYIGICKLDVVGVFRSCCK